VSHINVLVVEPDARARLVIVSRLKASGFITVVGIASDSMQARMQVKLRKPDVLVIATDQDTERVDSFLLHLLETAPLAVLMLSDKVLPHNKGERQAMRLGGAIVVKPLAGISSKDDVFGKKIAQQVQRIAANFKPVVTTAESNHATASKASKPVKKPVADSTAASPSTMKPHNPVLNTLLVIGASTGGTNALRRVVAEFPADFSAVLIVQHIPGAFAASFIDKLNKSSPMHVLAAIDGAKILHGHVYVGAGDAHLRIEKQGMALVCRVGGTDKVSGHCPSVNALFDSVAQHAGSKAVGALMTGMGEDGATGLKKMRNARAKTVAQDKESSVVWGMPGSAVALDAVDMQVSLDQLGQQLVKLVK